MSYARAVDCGPDHIFNAKTEECADERTRMGTLLTALEERLDRYDRDYFFRGCADGAVKNPVTRNCVDMDSPLGKVILANLDARTNKDEDDPFLCTPPTVFNPDTLKCVVPYREAKEAGRASCRSVASRDDRMAFVPHDEQVEVSEWFVDESENRGIVLAHSLGSGKTCTSILIIDRWMNKNPDGLVYIFLPGALRQNFLTEYCSRCGRDPSSVQERFRFVTFNYTFSSDNLPPWDNLEGNLVVVDEFSRLVLGMVNEGPHYSRIFEGIRDSGFDKGVFLTGTAVTSSPLEIYYHTDMCKYPNPFGTAEDFVNRLKVVNGRFRAVDEEEFIRCITGVYSILVPVPTLEGIEGYPTVESIHRFVPMTPIQYAIYVKRKIAENMARHPDNPNDPNYDDDRARYYLAISMLRSRQICNMYYPDEKAGNLELEQYAPKFSRIINDIRTTPGKHVVYSQFKTRYGIFFLADLLDELGITNLSFTGDYNDAQRSRILADFNAPSNNYGDDVKVLLITEAGAFGLNLFAVGTLHIVEQSISPVTIMQVEGRVMRYGAYSMFPLGERTVRVIKYFALTPGREYRRNTLMSEIPRDRHSSDIMAYDRSQSKIRSMSYMAGIVMRQPLVPRN